MISIHWLLAGLLVVAVAGAALVWLISRPFRLTLPRMTRLDKFFADATLRESWRIPAGARCEGAPFTWPADGYAGFFWGDSFSPPRRHTGLDIFGGREPGETPIYAVHDGFLTRLADWKSSVILRIPSDPLQPGRQIWLYYTHMADIDGNSFISADFPPGTSEAVVKEGQLLGYMGDYSGSPGNPTGVHLHFSIVLSGRDGSFLNESQLRNTLDPSAYFGRTMANDDRADPIPPCLSQVE